MAYSLGIFMSSHQVGVLHYEKHSARLSIVWFPQWQAVGFPASPWLPLNNQHNPNSAYNYLDNLLPEGEARNLLAQNLGVSEKQVYPQISALGRDLSGVFSFSEQPPKENTGPQFRHLTEDELAQRLTQKQDIGLLHWDEKPRLSVAGVQDKLNVFINPQGQIGFGDGALCSTHILKFERPDCQHLVLNELLCMKLSKAIGLATAEVAFKHFGEHPALLVERFDRMFDNKTQSVKRRHVIDGCQALDLPREYKYERNFGDSRDVKHIRDGASLKKLFKFCQQTSKPVESVLSLLRWQLFNLIINNYDSHGKNVSFYLSKDACTLSPAYDLVNVAMFPQFKHNLAMGIGDEFAPHDIHAYQLADFAQTCGLSNKLVARTLTQLANATLKELDSRQFLDGSFAETPLSKMETNYLDEVEQNIRQRAEHLLAQAEEIPRVEL